MFLKCCIPHLETVNLRDTAPSLWPPSPAYRLGGWGVRGGDIYLALSDPIASNPMQPFKSIPNPAVPGVILPFYWLKAHCSLCLRKCSLERASCLTWTLVGMAVDMSVGISLSHAAALPQEMGAFTYLVSGSSPWSPDAPSKLPFLQTSPAASRKEEDRDAE